MAKHRGMPSMDPQEVTPTKHHAGMVLTPALDGLARTRVDRSHDGTTTTRPKSMRMLHWLTVVFLILGVAAILMRDQVDGRAVRQWLLEGHRHFGLFVLFLFFARVALRIRLGKLPSNGETSWFMRLLAGLNHLALYALLLVQPLLGWALNSAEGKPTHLFGATLPALVKADEDLADQLQSWHLDAAWLLLGLISLHVLASLWHHFVLRDGTLRMMLPGRRR